MRNVQLAVCAVPIAVLTAYSADGEQLVDKGFFYGYDFVVWFACRPDPQGKTSLYSRAVVWWYGIGGLTVAVCIKYADNLLKNFATSVAIIVSTIASMYLFEFRPTMNFIRSSLKSHSAPATTRIFVFLSCIFSSWRRPGDSEHISLFLARTSPARPE